MRALIYGSGAVGTWVGCRLHERGIDTTFHGRGAHIAALARDGVLLHEATGPRRIRNLRAVERAEGWAAPDILFLGLKAHHLPPLLEDLRRLVGPHTAIIAPQNGV